MSNVGTRPSDVVSSPPREISPGVWWMPKCLISGLTGSISHVHTAPFLIVGEQETLLYDTGPPGHWSVVVEDLVQLLAGRRLDWIVPSHPEVPHCGNVHRLLERFPESTVTGDVRDYHIYYPQHDRRFMERERYSVIDLGGPRFRLLPAPIKDLPSTQWGYEETSQVMFVADAFSFTHRLPSEVDSDVDLPVHLEGECTLLSSELERPPKLDQIQWINERALFWTRYAKAEPFFEETEELLHRYPTQLIAPAHGAVIDDIDAVLPVIWEAYRGSYIGAK